MGPGIARYDGHSEWYDETFSASHREDEEAWIRVTAAVRADARRLPLPDASADVATGMYVHTDTEDFAAVISEVARCLRPGGRFAYLGVHPCYVGPFVCRLDEQQDQSLTFTVGYGTTGWASRGSGDGSKIGGRVGFHHKTLASFLQAFMDAS